MTAPTTFTGSDSDTFRLPTNVQPTHYSLTIKTNLAALTFEGFVCIDLDVKELTDRIVLHCLGLELQQTFLSSDTLEADLSLDEPVVDEPAQRISYNLDRSLPAGSKASLKIKFRSEIAENLKGYYKSAYKKDGETKYYALTQFAAIDARRAFPCWDEPLPKATYDMTMISRTDTTNLSNTPVLSEEVITPAYHPIGQPSYKALFFGLKDGEWKVTKFQTTPRMSSYLLVYANGHFEYLEDSVILPLSGKTIPLRIYTTAEFIHQGQFALDVKKAVLPIYEKLFDIEYPLPKLDTLVATDFDAGAMENWGLITGRTNAFLLDTQKADFKAKNLIAGIQTHEVAHMWFGNITTMEWWNYLYLNEGFATLIADVVVSDRVFPEWKVESSFISKHLNRRALSLDAQPSSHPIEVDCPDESYITQIFDSLSYSKAAAGVSLYLKNNLYGNSVTSDLWEGISRTTGVDVSKIMDNWIKKVGFPVLTVTEVPDGIHIRQDRFLETGKGQGKDNETIWNVPLRLLTVNNRGETILDSEALLTGREHFYKVDISKPYKLNAGTTGVYRVLYEPKTMVKLSKEATKENSAFSLSDRMGLVYDASALSKAGLAPVSSTLTMISVIGNYEKEFLVWDGIADCLRSLISTWWENQEIVDQLNDLRAALFSPLVERLGFEYNPDDSSDIIQLRTLAITEAATARDPKVVRELQSRFEHYMQTKDDSRIPADLQHIVFCTAVNNGGRAEYDTVVAIHNNPQTQTSRIAAIEAMCNTQDPQLLKETFDFITNKSRDQDIVSYFRGLSNNIRMRRELSTFFKAQYDTIMKRFGGSFSMTQLFPLSFGVLSTQRDLEETEAFFRDKDNSSYAMTLSQSLDSIRARIQFLGRSTVDLEEWLKKWQHDAMA